MNIVLKTSDRPRVSRMTQGLEPIFTGASIPRVTTVKYGVLTMQLLYFPMVNFTIAWEDSRLDKPSYTYHVATNRLLKPYYVARTLEDMMGTSANTYETRTFQNKAYSYVVPVLKNVEVIPSIESLFSYGKASSELTPESKRIIEVLQTQATLHKLARATAASIQPILAIYNANTTFINKYINKDDIRNKDKTP